MKKHLFCLAPLALAATLPASAQTVLTLSSWVPPTHTLTLAQSEWCEQVAKNAGGKIRCSLLPRAVAAPPDTYDAVKNGLADVSVVVHGYTPSRFVLPRMAEFPFLGDAAEPLSIAFDKVVRKYPAFAREHRGVHVIAFFTHGPGMLFNTRKPVAKLEDLQGLKWRVGGGIVNGVAQALNMNVALRPAAESYELLSSGVMDGTLLPAGWLESFKIDRIISHATLFPGGLYNTSFALVMNQAKYDKLSPDEKRAVDATTGEAAARIFGRHWDKSDRRAHALMQANNVQVTKADARFVNDIKSRTASLEKDWARDAEAKGLKNADKVLAEFRGEIARQQK